MNSAKKELQKGVSRRICISVKNFNYKTILLCAGFKRSSTHLLCTPFLTCEFYNFKGVEIRVSQLKMVYCSEYISNKMQWVYNKIVSVVKSLNKEPLCKD